MKNALMEFETIDASQVDDLMSRRPVRPPSDWDGFSSGPRSPSGDEPQDTKKSKKTGPIGGPAEEH